MLWREVRNRRTRRKRRTLVASALRLGAALWNPPYRDSWFFGFVRFVRHHTIRSISANPNTTTDITPFIVKNAASRRDKSCGLTR